MGRPAQRPAPGRSDSRDRGTSKAHVRLRPGRECARSARVAGLAAGSRASPGSKPAALGASSPCSGPSQGYRVPHCSRNPVSSPPGLARPPAWDANRAHGRSGHPTRTPPPPRSGPRSEGPQSPTWRLRLEKKSDFLSSLLRLESGSAGNSWNAQPAPFAVNPRFTEEKQLPPKSLPPPTPKAPRRFVKRSVRPEKYLSSWEKDVGNGTQ